MEKLTKSIRSTALIAILFIMIFAVLVFNQVYKESVRTVNAELEKCLKVSWELLRQKGSEFRIVDGKLLVDSYVINGNFEVPDKVQEIFGEVATVFMGDTRVSTNVLNADGSRAVGTRLEGPAYETIFKEGTSYRGEAFILGIPYLTAYDPIRDGKGEIIGSLFVGVKKVDFLSRFTGVKVQLSLLLLGLLAAFTTLMTLFWKVTKKFETAIVKQKEFAESLVRYSAVPTFVLDSQHRVIMWNKACEDLTGMKAAEMLGSNNQWQPFYTEKRAVLADIVIDGNFDDLPSLYGTFTRSAITPDGLQAEGWFGALNGRECFIFFDAETVRDREGKIIAAIETLQDITERKRAEIELDKSRQHLADIIEFNPEAIMVIDSGGKVNSWNRAMEELSGVCAVDMLGRGNYEYALPFYGERRPVLIDFAMLPGKEIENKYPHIERRGNTLVNKAYIHNARGEVLYIHSTAAALRNSSGEIIGAIESIRDITAQQLGLEKVRQSEEKFRLLFEMSPNGIGVMDLDGRLLMCNRQAAFMHGYEHSEEMVGLKIIDLITPESGADVAAGMENLVSGESQLIMKELSALKRDGSVFPVEFSASLIRDAALQPLAIIAVGHDITERKRAEEEIREKESKLRTITNTAQDAIVMINSDGKTTFWNPSAEKIFGYSFSEIMGKELHAILAPQKYHESFTNGLAQFRESGEGAAVGKTLELDAIRKGGEEFPVELSLSTILIEDKWHAVGIMRDITGRKLAERSLKREKDFSQALIESMPGLFYLINDKGIMQRWNKNFEEVLGYSADEISSSSRQLFFAEQDQELINAKIQEIFASGKAVTEANFVSKNGQEMPYLLTGVRIVIDEVPFLVGIGIDISELKRAEAEIRELNENLDRKVIERTKQLVAAQEELVVKEKLSILGQLSGSVGHELRNPLGVMNNAIYFLKIVLTDADETTKEYLDIVKKEIDNSLRIITDLLDFARTRPPQRHAVSVEELIRQSLERCCLPNNVAVTVDSKEALPRLNVDPLQMEQVLTNFITNAVQAMPNGGTLRIAARSAGAGLAPAEAEHPQLLPRQDFVKISVADSGEGITPENMRKLFQPLFTTKAKGIGLGLVVCRNLAEANGGRIEVTSEPGKGTTFSVALPIEGEKE